MFWYILAGYLKCGTVRELKQRMDSVEFSYWKAIHKYIGPIGDLRDDYRAAKICSIVHASGLHKVRPSEDFLLKFERGQCTNSQTQTTEEAEVAINTFLSRKNGDDSIP